MYGGSDIKKHKLATQNNILKGFVNSDIGNDIEKARNVGDIHPNGKWVWTEYKPGKFDWRTIPKGSRPGGDEVKQRVKFSTVGELIKKLGDQTKGFLYFTDGKRVSQSSLESRLEKSKTGVVSIMDVDNPNGTDGISRSDMKDDKIFASYGVMKDQLGQKVLMIYHVSEGSRKTSPTKSESGVSKGVNKKSWSDFISYSSRSKIPDSLQRMTLEELKDSKSKAIARRDNPMLSKSSRQVAREKIWDLEDLIRAHEKVEKYNNTKI